MTIDSVPVTRQAFLNTGSNEVNLPASLQSGSVQLTIHPNDIQNRIVQCGVPLPIGGTSSVNELVLKNDQGQEIEAQFDVLGEYPDGSIRSVFVTTEVVADPTSEKLYYLDYGAGVSRNTYATNIGYTEDANEFIVTTGKIRATLDKQTGALFKSVYLDTAQDQSYSTQILGASEITTHDVLDNDKEYLASNETSVTWTVMRSGPMNVQLRAVGYMKDSGGSSYTQFRVWIDFYNDDDQIKIQHTLVDDVDQPGVVIANPLAPVKFAALDSVWTFQHSISSGHQYIFGGENGQATGSFTTEQFLFQDGKFPFNQNGFINPDPTAFSHLSYTEATRGQTAQSFAYAGVQTGQKAKGYATCHNGTIGVTSMIRDFWELYPKELSMDTSEIKIHLHPARTDIETDPVKRVSIHFNEEGLLEEPKSINSLRRGIAVTNYFILQFHTTAPDAAVIEAQIENFNDRRFKLQCTSDHYCSSKWLFDLKSEDAAQVGYHDDIKSIVERGEIWARDMVLPYGWMRRGDRLREIPDNDQNLPEWYQCTHIGGVKFFNNYIKTFDEVWLKWWAYETQHMMDIDIMHSRLVGWAKKPEFEPYPAGMFKCTKHNMVYHDAHNTHYGHLHYACFVPEWLINGDHRAYEVAKEIAYYFDHLVLFEMPIPRPVVHVPNDYNRGFIEAERDFGWPFYVRMEWAKLANDRDFFIRNCKHTMDYCVEWWKVKRDRIQGDIVVGYYDWEAGTGTLALDDTDNGAGSGTKSTGNQMWLMGSILWPMVDFIEQEQYFQTGADIVTYKQMLFQILEQLFVWSYKGDGESFEDSEARRPGYANGASGTQCISAVIYIYRYFKEELAAGRISNPEWFRPWLWRYVFGNLFDKYASGNFTDWVWQGIYGYESTFPDTCWTHRAEFQEGETDPKFLSQAGWEAYLATL